MSKFLAPWNYAMQVKKHAFHSFDQQKHFQNKEICSRKFWLKFKNSQVFVNFKNQLKIQTCNFFKAKIIFKPVKK